MWHTDTASTGHRLELPQLAPLSSTAGVSHGAINRFWVGVSAGRS